MRINPDAPILDIEPSDFLHCEKRALGDWWWFTLARGCRYAETAPSRVRMPDGRIFVVSTAVHSTQPGASVLITGHYVGEGAVDQFAALADAMEPLVASQEAGSSAIRRLGDALFGVAAIVPALTGAVSRAAEAERQRVETERAERAFATSAAAPTPAVAEQADDYVIEDGTIASMSVDRRRERHSFDTDDGMRYFAGPVDITVDVRTIPAVVPDWPSYVRLGGERFVVERYGPTSEFGGPITIDWTLKPAGALPASFVEWASRITGAPRSRQRESSGAAQRLDAAEVQRQSIARLEQRVRDEAAQSRARTAPAAPIIERKRRTITADDDES